MEFPRRTRTSTGCRFFLGSGGRLASGEFPAGALGLLLVSASSPVTSEVAAASPRLRFVEVSEVTVT